jgi:2-dehydro-3-deoxyphosphogalactonate aldolase
MSMTEAHVAFSSWLKSLPLIAILRGVKPEEVIAIGQVLEEYGFAIIEIPLNSPDPITSIAWLSQHFGDRLLTGAGTVLRAEQVAEVADAGGKLIVMPHADAAIVAAAKARGLYAVPGFATPSEAFAMLAAGADALKLFPAEANPPPVLRALRAVLPKEVPILPVGSITPQNMRGYLDAGAHGFGLGSALYRPGDTPEIVGTKARAFVEALRAPA